MREVIEMDRLLGTVTNIVDNLLPTHGEIQSLLADYKQMYTALCEGERLLTQAAGNEDVHGKLQALKEKVFKGKQDILSRVYDLKDALAFTDDQDKIAIYQRYEREGMAPMFREMERNIALDFQLQARLDAFAASAQQPSDDLRQQAARLLHHVQYSADLMDRQDSLAGKRSCYRDACTMLEQAKLLLAQAQGLVKPDDPSSGDVYNTIRKMCTEMEHTVGRMLGIVQKASDKASAGASQAMAARAAVFTAAVAAPSVARVEQTVDADKPAVAVDNRRHGMRLS